MGGKGGGKEQSFLKKIKQHDSIYMYFIILYNVYHKRHFAGKFFRTEKVSGVRNSSTVHLYTSYRLPFIHIFQHLSAYLTTLDTSPGKWDPEELFDEEKKPAKNLVPLNL